MSHRVFRPVLRSLHKLQHRSPRGQCRHFGTLSDMGYVSNDKELNILSNPSFQVIAALRALMATTIAEPQSHPPASEKGSCKDKSGKSEANKRVTPPK